MRKYAITLWFGGLFLLLATAQGCSLFRSKSDSAADDNNSFHATTASTTNNPVPLPVEIANDISKISTDDQLTTAPSSEPAPAPLSKQTQPAAAAPAPASVIAAEDEEQDDQSSAPTPVPKTHKRHGKNERYVVHRGDTLMKISFVKYGNMYRWREIYDANRRVIHKFNSISKGMILTIKGVEYVVIEKNGRPYLIRRNDTLAKISNGVYGTPTHWRSIWKNNPHLIHNPDKIYAGFTLYYVPSTGPVPVEQKRLTKKLPAADSPRQPAQQE